MSNSVENWYYYYSARVCDFQKLIVATQIKLLKVDSKEDHLSNEKYTLFISDTRFTV